LTVPIQAKLNFNGLLGEQIILQSDQVILAVTFGQAKITGKAPIFEQMHRCIWNKLITLSPSFSFKKRLQRFETINDTDTFDLIYFDAFGAQVQPELWQEAIFQQMYTSLKQGGYLVTYAAKGSVRRAMQACGFTVERLPGPPMKREMLRAHKD